MSQNSNTKIIGRIAGTLFAFAAGIVVYNEGMKTKAYQDSAGVWTICAGETKGVKKGDTATPSECSAMLATSLVEHAGALEGLPDTTSDVVLLGGVDMAYNVGVTAFRTSTVKKHLMKKDYAQASTAVLDWRFISKQSKASPGAGWVHKTGTRWTFDCSQYINGKPNKVCWGLWERRQWQAQAIGNRFDTPAEALEALKKL